MFGQTVTGVDSIFVLCDAVRTITVSSLTQAHRSFCCGTERMPEKDGFLSLFRDYLQELLQCIGEHLGADWVTVGGGLTWVGAFKKPSPVEKNSGIGLAAPACDVLMPKNPARIVKGRIDHL